MNDSQTLEMQIKTTGEQTLKVLNQINSTLSGMSTNLSKAGTSAKNIEKIGDLSSKASSKIDKLGNSFKRLFTFAGAKLVATKAMDFLDSAVNRAEELNLFNVIFKNIEKDGVKSFSTLGEEAMRFQNKLNEAFGTNKTETLRYQGLFQAMATNQGIDERHAAIMSENMVKLTYDLASLYNRSEKTTAEALRAGVYAGMTKPLRGYGLDVTEKSLKNVLPALGITDRSISDMNQAEKEILRYISTLNQARSAMGDFAETIESPANQLKIFKQQLVEVKAAIGNLFMGLYAEILPYANAILMVIKEIVKAIANFFGIETQDYNTGIGSLEDTYEGFENVGNGASKAAKAAKELKRQVLGFDQINNLTTPSKTGSGGGSGSGGLTGGIDKRLLDAISGYDNLMDKVRMKANQIRDRWMEILGFKKEINPLTGEIEWKYQGLGTTVKNLWNRFKELNPQTRLFVGALSIATITKIIAAIKKLSNSLGFSGLLKNITGLFSPLKTMTGYTKLYWNLIGDAEKGTKKLSSSLSSGIDAWYKSATGAERFSAGIKGAVMSVGGLALMKTAVDDIAQSGLNLINVAEGIGGAFSTIFGGVQTGAAIGGSTGALVGGLVGAIPVVVELIRGIGYAFDEDRREFEKLKKEIDTGYDNWLQSSKDINDAFSKSNSTWDYYSRLNNELTQIVDENGKVKEGYEDRAEFIAGELSRALGVEIKLSDNVVENYKKVEKQIVNLIEQKKAMAKLNALEVEYNKALEQQGPAEERKRKAFEAQKQAIKEFNKKYEKYAQTLNISNKELMEYVVWGKESARMQEILNDKSSETVTTLVAMNGQLKDERNAVRETTSEYQKASKELDGWNSTIDTWDKMYSLALKGKYKEINDYSKHTRNIIGKDLEQRTDYWNKIVSEQKTNLEMLELDRKNMSTEAYNARKKEFENERTLAESELEKLNLIVKTKNGDLSKETIEAWKKMGENSTDEFKIAFNELPNDIKQVLLDGLKGSGLKITEQLQKELNKNQPKTSISLDISSAKNKLNELAKQINSNLVLKISSLFKAKGGVFNGTLWSNIPQYANGGAPSHGSLFWAGENGAEIVANSNRRTEVLNRSQIASSIYSAVVSAMSQFNGGTTQVELIAHTDEGVVIDRINQKTKQTGRCPINIPSY